MASAPSSPSRRHRFRLVRSIGAITQTSDTAASAVLADTWQHVVAVFGSGQNNALFVNGQSIPLTHTGAAPTGALAIATSDELSVGDSSETVSPIVGFPGDLGRVTIWPYVMTGTQAMVSYRL